MAECCGTGAKSKLAIGLSAGTPTRMDFLKFVPHVVKTLVDGGDGAIRGTLDHQKTNVGEGLLHVRFRTSMWLTAAKLDILLPCLGFTESPTDTFTLGDDLPDSTIIVGPAGAPEETYTGCIPTDFVIYGQKGSDPIAIDIGWLGKTYAEDPAGTFFISQTNPAMTEGYIYPFGDGVNNINTLNALGQTIAFPQFRLQMDYKTKAEFNNSVTATNICPFDHELKVMTSALYSTCDGTTGLLTGPIGGNTDGAPLTLTLGRTVGTDVYGTVITVANAKLVAQPPKIVKNDWNRLPLVFEGYASGNTPLLVITNDAT